MTPNSAVFLYVFSQRLHFSSSMLTSTGLGTRLKGTDYSTFAYFYHISVVLTFLQHLLTY